MGWLFIIMGLGLVAIGSFVSYYGQQLLSEKPSPPVPVVIERLLSPPQERLLALLFQYQREFTASKLVIGRQGELLFDEPERQQTVKVNFLTELYGSKNGDLSRAPEFASLMESLPTEYVRFHAEMRWDSPFVVNVTTEGVKYLRIQK